MAAWLPHSVYSLNLYKQIRWA